MHPELDGRTLDIVHCFYNIARHFLRWKVAFSALINLQILLTVRVLTKNRTTCFSKALLFSHAYICKWQNKCIKIPHISRPAQNIWFRCQGKSLFKVYSFNMMQPLASLGFFESFWRVRRRDEQLLKMESKLHDIGLKCWFSTTVDPQLNMAGKDFAAV